MTPQRLLVLKALKRMDLSARPSEREIAEEAGVSRRTAQRALKELVASGHVTSEGAQRQRKKYAVTELPEPTAKRRSRPGPPDVAEDATYVVGLERGQPSGTFVVHGEDGEVSRYTRLRAEPHVVWRERMISCHRTKRGLPHWREAGAYLDQQDPPYEAWAALSMRARSAVQQAMPPGSPTSA